MVPYTCPLIDEAISTLKFECNHHTTQIVDELVPMQDFRSQTIHDVIQNLEDLREMNKALRYDAGYWKKLYEYAMYGDMNFNPETLPRN